MSNATKFETLSLRFATDESLSVAGMRELMNLASVAHEITNDELAILDVQVYYIAGERRLLGLGL